MTQIYFRRIIFLIIIILPFTEESTPPHAKATSCSLSISASYTQLIMEISTNELSHDRTGMRLNQVLSGYSDKGCSSVVMDGIVTCKSSSYKNNSYYYYFHHSARTTSTHSIVFPGFTFDDGFHTFSENCGYTGLTSYGSTIYGINCNKFSFMKGPTCKLISFIMKQSIYFI